jgi:DNA-binding XRE family transcriptional regulator
LSGKPKWDQARGRYADKMRKRGTPLMVTPEEFAAAARLLERARRYGMSDRMIGEQAGISATLPSKVRRGAIRTMRRDTFERLSKLHPERPVTFVSGPRGKVGGGSMQGSVGTLRRVQALRRDGFPGWLVGERLGVSYEAVAQLAKSGRVVVLESTRIDVARVYQELDGKTPADFGVPPNVAGKCSTWAARRGYVPRSCWDSDTIDDPAAIPEWTGRCGTVYGRMIHQAEGIPVCVSCANVPAEPVFDPASFRTLRERRGLSRPQLGKLIGVNPSTIQYWEAGRSTPTRQNKIDLALKALDGTYEDVYQEVSDGWAA